MTARRAARILAVAAIGLAPPAALPAAPASLPTTTANEIDAPPEAAARMTIAVRINGQGPFPFILDTGADRTVISRELAQRLGLPKGPGAILHDSAGVGRTDTVRIASLGFGTREVNGINAATLAAANLGAAGMLGIDSLHDQHVIIDFNRDRITLEPAIAEPDPDPGAIVVRAKRRFGQLILVDATAKGVRIDVIVDTGAQNSVGNDALRRLLDQRSFLPKSIPTEIISVTGRRVPAVFIPVEEVRLGGIAVRNLPVAFADLHTFRQFGLARRPAMLLGMDVLRQFERVSIDFPNKKVRLLLRKR